ncbi:iron uptake system component EfeO [Paenibacillus cellulosilyticus]|uniref:Iron uptake system component EfeO n=1 Tax=Paenibacillus cellulosilyticus TaxID=375489 RepID=A0A2V2YLB9_9BACL|nr:iron uptake system protein EfeO [Paenibacillus cellulosilyticus]PWV94277.1 iron uptake system component EfeO [Paenibacillus cellulosilyticus]QKS44239.1 EfeM/EfeO family lipoprotein [Paenibacillus cellulosilyticus]
MKAKLLFASLVLAMSVVFAGCSSDNSKETDAAAQPADTTQASTDSTDLNAKLKDVLEQYRQFSIEQSDQLIVETEKFVNAVKSGDLEQAKLLYAPTRMYYERIEPIAEALGNFDPDIDARDGDVEAADWRGFHRIEKGLWEDNATAGTEEFADRLLSDVKSLRALMETVEVDTAMLTTGAVELLNEVSSSKVTGEEERYSHTDLYDFVANVEGAKKIYELLQPELSSQDADLEKSIGEKFTALEALLAKYKSGDGYVAFTELKEDDTRTLSQALDALAEPLSQMGKALGV